VQSKKLAKLIEIYETTEDICRIIIYHKISTVFLVSHFSITFLAAKELIYIYICKTVFNLYFLKVKISQVVLQMLNV